MAQNDEREHERQDLKTRWTVLKQTTAALDVLSHSLTGTTDTGALEAHRLRLENHRRDLVTYDTDLAAYHAKWGPVR